MNQYYYLNARNEQQGPVAANQLLSVGVTRDTKVWTQGMTQWQSAGEVAELAYLFNGQNGAVPPAYNNGQMASSAPQNQYGAQYSYADKPNNFLVWSVLSTVLCCLPLGVVGIIYASKVDTLWNQGKYEEAKKSAKQAKTFTIISAVLGFVGGILYFFLVLFAELAGKY